MMTEQRFGIIKTKTYGLYVPVDKMKVYNFSGFESELDCIRVVNALNDLEEKSRENGKIASKFFEENEKLKQAQASMLREFEKGVKKVQKLAKENGELKADNNRLVNETAKIIAEHQRRVLDLIDKRINALEIDYNKAVKAGMPSNSVYGEIELLEELKKELQE